MMPNRVVACLFAVGLLIAMTLAWTAGAVVGTETVRGSASSAVSSKSAATAVERREAHVAEVDLSMTRLARQMGLQPRSMVRPRSDEVLRRPEGALSDRLIVKFMDGAEARTSRTPAQQVQSVAMSVDLAPFNEVLDRFGLTTRQAMTMPAERLQELEMVASERSGRAQPDLAGIVYVEGPPAQLEQAAKLINDLPFIEFVEFEGILDPEGITENEFKEMVERVQAQTRRTRTLRKDEPETSVADTGGRILPPMGLRSYELELKFDSGLRSASDVDHAAPGLTNHRRIYSQVVGEEGAPWARVHFGDVELSGSVEDGTASYIKITSLKNGDSQILNAKNIKSWRNSSGHFNGGLVLVELFAKPETGPSRITIDRMTIGEWHSDGPMALNICDDVDSRELVFDPDEEECSGIACVTGRLMPSGCTAFIFRDDGDFNDNKLWVMTAGSCVVGQEQEFIQFNVPLADEDTGTPGQPSIADQFPLRPIALFNKEHSMDCGAGGCGRNWALLKIDPVEGNPVDTYEVDDDDIYRMVSSPPEATGQNILVRGYGTTMTTPGPLEWNGALKDSIGPLIDSDLIFGMQYRADSSSGDNGAPVTLLGPDGEATNELIAIHTCGGCAQVGGSNGGASVNLPDIVHALAAAFVEDVEDPFLFNTGACCLAGECFTNMSEEDCDDTGGTFAGIGTECGDWPCQSNLVCCVGVGDTASLCLHTDEWTCRVACGTVTGPVIPDVWECDFDEQPTPCDDDPDCGSPNAGNCFYSNFTTGCALDDPPNTICSAVCAVDPDCCADPGAGVWRFGGWDEICAWHARRLFPSAGLAIGPNATEHPCFQTVGDCHSENPTIGCEDPACCLSVCMHDPLCCEPPFRWDSVCAELAGEICPVFDPAGSTPDLTVAQGYLTPEGYMEQMEEATGLLTVPSPVILSMIEGMFNVPVEGEEEEIDLAMEFARSSLAVTRPDTFPQFFQPLSGWGGEGFDLDGLWEYAESLGTGKENLTRGKSTRIGVLYPSAFVQPTDGTPSTDNDQTHEDLRGRVIYPEVGQTQIILPDSPTTFLTGHAGTAILGIIGANPDNGIGMRGISPDADLHFFPTVSVEEGGRFFNALANAIDLFDPGDVIVIPYTPRPVNFSFASAAAANLLFALATDLGISTVIAAGDFGAAAAPVVPQAGEVDSGVVVVGAVTPGQPFYRAGFSRYCTGTPCADIEAVHTAAWGQGVATLGFGDLFMGETDGEPDPLRSYTNTFGGRPDLPDAGTGAAAAQVAATMANLQGVAKMFFGIPMSPIQIRGEYSGNANLQAGFGINSLGPPGTGNDPSFDGDWDLGADPKVVGSIVWPDPISGGGLISLGVMSDLPLAAELLITGGYFSNCPNLKAAHTIRGERVQGSVASVCEVDGVVYTIESQPTSGSSSPSFVPSGFEGPVGDVVYRANGQLADLFVVGQANSTFITSYSVVATIAPTNVQTIVGLELYDFVQGRWIFTAANVFGPGEGGIIATPDGFTFNPQRFFNSEAESLVRVWGFTFGTPPSPGGSPGPIPFLFNIDAVELDILTFGTQPEEEE